MKNKNGTDVSGVWIFQAVPTSYEIKDEVPERLKRGAPIERWWVGQHADDMVVGDRVLLWRSGEEAGIYGTGTLVSFPYRRERDRWIDVKFDPLLKNPVHKDRLQRHPQLRNLSIIRMARGTNFTVTSAEWEKLQPLLGLRESETKKERRREEDRFPDIDPKNQRDARKRVLAEIVRRQGQPEFRRRLLHIFAGRCPVTGCNAEAVLEAAHITPYKGARTNTPRNGLLLRSDLHTLFDFYLITIDATTRRIRCAPSLKGTMYSMLEGKQLKLPKGGPSPKALNWHKLEFLRRLKSTPTQ